MTRQQLASKGLGELFIAHQYFSKDQACSLVNVKIFLAQYINAVNIIDISVLYWFISKVYEGCDLYHKPGDLVILTE